VESKNVECVEVQSRIVVIKVWGKQRDVDQRVQTFSYKTSKFCRSNAQHGGIANDNVL
jgi:hypothetical protein